MTPNPFLKYIIKEAVQALETRVDSGKKEKKRHAFRAERIGVRWFGLLPLSFKMVWQKRKKS
ncbi:YqzE family protein [Salibacterium halotolerans]|uniref:YqzE-like protein n=1 Tax=Salibacterium halotolerans TaxID=1884432 RepID=A0A1I5NLG9_9BACI|nr:YqzE family protein [Salibacterium halotolerans]SFP22572.1 YqzE-like protein [Salibacterium halotolerans]